jgi:hypothetical protein
VGLVEDADMCRPRLAREFDGGRAHAAERVLEIAAGVFQRAG